MMHQWIVPLRIHQPGEYPARATQVPPAILRGIEGGRGVDIASRPRQQEMRERIAAAGHFGDVLLDIPSDIE